MIQLKYSKDSFFELRPEDTVMVNDVLYIVEKTTRGGMGFVVLLRMGPSARQTMTALGMSLALKAVLPGSSDEGGEEMFKRELAVWAGFRHRNLVRLLDIFDGGDAGWVAAMDWHHGSLADYLKSRGKLSLKESTRIMLHLIEGLDYAYCESQVLHLDLKPANVLYGIDIDSVFTAVDLTDAPALKYRFMISDWGIASVKKATFAALLSSGNLDMQTLNNIGTTAYMAPERFIPGTSSSLASDVFSLGLMYYEMLTGQLPWAGGADPRRSITSGEYHADAARTLVFNKVAKPISLLILAMMAFDPADRPDSYKLLRRNIVKSYRKSSIWWAKIIN